MKIRNVTIELKGSAPLGWTKYVEPKKANEDADEYEERVFADRMPQDGGNVALPVIALKRAIETAASKLDKKFGKLGVKGVLLGALIPSAVYADTGIPAKDIGHEWLFLPQGGKKNSCVSKKVPVVQSWEASFPFTVVDDRITKDLLQELVETAGMIIGLGFWRPEKGGAKGRFTVKKIKWS